VIIVYGTRCYGTIEEEDGSRHATRFAHIYYLPLFPVGGFRLVTDDTGIPMPINGKSMLLGYARVWGFFALGGFIAATYLNYEKSLVSGGIMAAVTLGAIAAWAFAMLKAGYKSPIRPVAAAFVLGIPLLALGGSVVAGVNERMSRMKWEKEFALNRDDNIQKAEELLAKLDKQKQDGTGSTGGGALSPKLQARKDKCDQGVARECNELGYDLKDIDPVASLEAYTKGCDGDDGMACFNEALVISKKDPKAAFMLYEQSCDLDYADGCNNLGTKLENDDSVKAVSLFQKGCDLKSGLACRNLAHMYELGKGTKKNARQAKTLYKQACTMGDTVACSKKG